MTTPTVTILDKRIQHFSLWDGEVGVTVFRHMGLHGFPDAVVVVRRPDDPIALHQYNAAYHRKCNDKNLSVEQQFDYRTRLMDQWIEDKLVELATGVAGTSTIEPGEEGYLFG